MNIFEHAIALKDEKEAFYRQLSQQCSNKGVQRLFRMLADEEEGHKKVIENMAQKIPAKLADSQVLRDAKAAFSDMFNDPTETLCGPGQIELYRKAVEYEKKAEKFYLEKEKQVQEDHQKDIFRRIAEEEVKHRQVLESVLDLVERPQRWLENAEWYHLDEY